MEQHRRQMREKLNLFSRKVFGQILGRVGGKCSRFSQLLELSCWPSGTKFAAQVYEML